MSTGDSDDDGFETPGAAASDASADASEPTPDSDSDSDPDRDSEPAPDSNSNSDSDIDSDLNPESDLQDPPVAVGRYDWEDFKREYYYDDGDPPEEESFDPAAHLGFPPAELGDRIAAGGDALDALADTVEERTVRIDPDVDEDAFFSNDDGTTTVVTRYDLERAVPQEKKSHFREVDRYWVNKPYAFVVVFHSEKENEKKYYLVEPHLSPLEADLREFLVGKLKTAIKYSDGEVVMQDGEDARSTVIETELHNLLERYDLYAEGARPDDGGLLDRARRLVGLGAEPGPDADADPDAGDDRSELQGHSARPEPAVLAEGSKTLTEHQIEKLLYLLKRDFIGFERIDGIKHDINVEDISCDGYESPVFVYHSEYEQIISNVYHGTEELDEFVVKLAQRSGKGISKRSPQVDATLPDGSRAQLTLGREVSDHGTNYTIRQFKDVPHTPIDLINWNTFSLEEMAFCGSASKTRNRSSSPAAPPPGRRPR